MNRIKGTIKDRLKTISTCTNGKMTYRFTSRFLIGLSLCFFFFRCSSGSRTIHQHDSILTPFSIDTPTPDPVSTTEAIQLITALEQDPLSEDAPAQRTVLTVWVVASPDVGELVLDEAYIHGLLDSDHPYSSELFLQYMVGIARAQALAGSTPLEKQIAVESGLRSMLAAYKSLIAGDESMRDRFLDELDRIRQFGRLRLYIDKVDKSRDR